MQLFELFFIMMLCSSIQSMDTLHCVDNQIFSKNYIPIQNVLTYFETALFIGKQESGLMKTTNELANPMLKLVENLGKREDERIIKEIFVEKVNDVIENKMKEIQPDQVKKITDESNEMLGFHILYAHRLWICMKVEVLNRLLNFEKYLVKDQFEEVVRHAILLTYLDGGWHYFQVSIDKLQNLEAEINDESRLKIIYDYYYAVELISLARIKLDEMPHAYKIYMSHPAVKIDINILKDTTDFSRKTSSIYSIRDLYDFADSIHTNLIKEEEEGREFLTGKCIKCTIV